MRAIFFILFSIQAAQAGVLDPFTHPTLPACNALPHKQLPVECRERLSPNDLASILPIASRLTKDEQIRKMREHASKRMQEEIDLTIESRQKLLACFKDPSPECKTRIDFTKSLLEENLKRLRIALALSVPPKIPQDHSVSPWIKYPPSLGAGALPRLSQEELDFAFRFHKTSVNTLQKIATGKVKRELGVKVSDVELRERCQNRDIDLLPVCIRIDNLRNEAVVNFRTSMSKIADAIISDLPLTVRFTELPITDEKLEKELRLTLSTLKEWKTETLKPDPKAEDARLFHQMSFVNEYVLSNPGMCDVAEEEIHRIALSNMKTSLFKTGASVVGMGVLCSVATPLVCFSVGSAMGGYGLGSQAIEINKARARFSSADRENPQANLHSLEGKHRDLLISTAFTLLGTAKGLQSISLPKEATMSTVAIQLESQSGGFFSRAGEQFSKATENVLLALKDAAISEVSKGVGELAEDDSNGTYNDWTRSDAFTARVYESFLRNHYAR